MPSEVYEHGVNKLMWYEERFGADRVKTFEPRLRQAFARAGIEGEYSLDGNTGPTSRGHRLAYLAESKYGRETQDKFMEAIFTRYFLKGETPCDRDVLLAAATEAGLDREECEKVIADDDAFAAEVEEQKRRFAARVSGVPHFIISHGGRRLEFGGAQPPDVFAEAFVDLLGIDELVVE